MPHTFNLAQKRFFQPVTSQKPRTDWVHVPHTKGMGRLANGQKDFCNKLIKSVLSKKLYLLKGLIIVQRKISVILPKFLSIILSIISKLHQFSVLRHSVPLRDTTFCSKHFLSVISF